ncbi:hypothetical protein [Roseateles sp.]|uniref:hypothetical protein n=1 Tax=Roseateles sp. TaxID=1971397 RepID=UPI003BA68E06
MNNASNSQDHSNPAADAKLGADAQAKKLAARRSLLKGGLAAAPVVMSAASRPVLAQTQCHGPTGFQSANISRMVGTGVNSCGSRKNPAAWLSQINDLPHPYKKTDKFNVLFAGTTKFSEDKHTLGSVLNSNATGNDIAIAKLAIAALLNTASTQVPTAEDIRKLWAGYCSGNYRPNGEAAWPTSKFIIYLNYTMGVAVPKTSW